MAHGLIRPIVTFGVAGALVFVAVDAQANPRHAQIVVDADTNQILYEDNATAPRRPASITKVMTLYMLFDALEKGVISWDHRIVFSRFASGQAPTKLGVPPGGSISVQTAVEALIVRSANDVAAAVAEALGGSEPAFARMMTEKARQLGMAQTNFANASGLPHPAQISTAEDLARLAIAIRRDFPDQFHWFSTRSMVWNGQTISGHNHLLGRVVGVDGLKTGYTRASGFNLAATAERNGRRVVTVVLGGANRFERDDLVEALIETAYNDIGVANRAMAAGVSAYQIAFRDSRDAADAAALVMDLPPPRPAAAPPRFTMAGTTRSARDLTFQPATGGWQVADMTVAARVAAAREAQDTGSSEQTDEAEAPAPRVVAALPTPRPVPVPVPVRAPVPVPVPVPVPMSTAPPQAAAATPVPVPAATPDRAPAPVEALAPVAVAITAPPPAPAPTAAPALRGTVEEAPPEPTLLAATTPAPAVGDPEATPAPAPDPTVAPPPEAPAPALMASVEAPARTTEPDPALNGMVDVNAPVGMATSEAPVAAETRMAALDPELIEAARLRQVEADARAQARLVAAQAEDEARRAAERERLERLRAERARAEREARRVAEADAKAKAEREATLNAERQAAARAVAVREERERQAAAARAANARGTAVVQVGAFKREGEARSALAELARHFPSFAKREVTSVTRADGTWYRARFSGLAASAAREACRLVTGRGGACQIVAE
jgi:D-alanyl-D-alanine carboxypeptidase